MARGKLVVIEGLDKKALAALSKSFALWLMAEDCPGGSSSVECIFPLDGPKGTLLKYLDGRSYVASNIVAREFAFHLRISSRRIEGLLAQGTHVVLGGYTGLVKAYLGIMKGVTATTILEFDVNLVRPDLVVVVHKQDPAGHGPRYGHRLDELDSMLRDLAVVSTPTWIEVSDDLEQLKEAWRCSDLCVYT